jgi:sulfatase modifying factor 1
MSWPVRRAFAAAVTVLAVGCGGRTTGSVGTTGSGGASGSVGGTGSVSAGVSSGVATGDMLVGSGDPSSGANGSAGSASGCDRNLCSCQPGPYCDLQCPKGLIQCLVAFQCYDPQTDPNNCGGCYQACSPEQTCQNGNCVPPVDAGSDGMGIADDVDGSCDLCGDAGADVGTPPSCAPGGPGMTNCGPGGSGTESCCASLEVIGGTYYRTYDLGYAPGTSPPVLAADGGPTSEADPATVSAFKLDKYLVTAGRFRQFVSAWNGGWMPAAGSGKHTHLNGGNGLAATGGGFEPGWVATDDSNIAPTNANLACDPNFATWAPYSSAQENLPINCVNSWESYAFCIWDGGFLPSEAEWEYAAAGGSQQREYPWGSAAPGTACPGTGCQYAIYNCDYPNGSGTCSAVGNIAPVGTATLGAGLWGQLDLAGELWEWNLDWSANYAACTDCADFTATSQPNRVFRGGNFINDSSDLLPPSRYGNTPTYRGSVIGFRCARTP